MPPPSRTTECETSPHRELPSFSNPVRGDRAWIKLVLWSLGIKISEDAIGHTGPTAFESVCALTSSCCSSIYRVTLNHELTETSFKRLPYTSKVRIKGAKTLLFKSMAVDDVFDRPNWVENEVAAMHMSREALRRTSPLLERLIPDVYAWHSKADEEYGRGWIIMEDKIGDLLSKHWDGLEPMRRSHVMNYLALVNAWTQTASLPLGGKLYGGLSIDIQGEIVVGGTMAGMVAKGGPWDSYGDLWKDRLEYVRQLVSGILSSNLEGWLAHSGVQTNHRALVNPQLIFLNNILFDPNSKMITGLLNFDRCSILPPIHQFLPSPQDPQRQHDLRELADNLGLYLDCPFTSDIDVIKVWESALERQRQLGPRFNRRQGRVVPSTAMETMVRLEEELAPLVLAIPLIGEMRVTNLEAEHRRAEKSLLERLRGLKLGRWAEDEGDQTLLQ
ncbi:uncharacterized protein DNG_07563 [Cephalotrichum gorgonifer]|uniref:Uncharacterized protein n=1 Tax=Cephalotrichum gorgonifer TaxID=2041049 RepID=A0AAE8N3S0_9PEZI|nr:uncharacterized protein DNG_07563 [Cephalotrichum gorgonifer]